MPLTPPARRPRTQSRCRPARPATRGSEAGVPVRANGIEMPLLELIECLETIAGAHGVGRIDMVENRLMGIKSREIYEAPAAVVLHAAHSELEKFVIAARSRADQARYGRAYADSVYNGLWFSQTREAIDAFVAAIQPRVTGSVRLKLFKGDCRVVGRDRITRSTIASWPPTTRAIGSITPPPKGSSRSGAFPRKPRRANGRAAPRQWDADDGPPLVRTICGRSRRRPVRVRRLLQVRSAALRRRCDRQSRVGRGAREGGRADGRRRVAHPSRARGHRGKGDIRSGFLRVEDARHDEDVHSFVERELVARVGDAGRRLHTGRSRNEQVSVDLRLYLKRRIPQVQQRGRLARPRCSPTRQRPPAPR